MKRTPLRPMALVWALVAHFGHQGALAAQDRAAETRALSEARSLEVRGELSGAVLVLERVLATHPRSARALVALDRLLRDQRRSLELLPFLNRFLSEDADAPAVRALKLRILAEADSVDAVEREARAWIRADPRDVERYRLSVPHWERTLGVEGALELLVEGRDKSGHEGALAAEMGDLLLKSNRPEDAAREWARAVDGSTAQAAEVVRRIRLLHPDARTAFVDAIVAALDGPGAGPESRILAVQLALLDGRGQRALAIARDLAPGLDRATRAAFLQELARWGEDANASDVTIWSLDSLREFSGGGDEGRALDQRIADLALAAGDTSTAMEAGERLAAAAPSGSFERRQRMAEQIRMRVRSADVSQLEDDLARFRREFPGAPESDELAAAVSAAIQRQGDLPAAAAVVADVPGPRSALARAYVSLARGELELASASLAQAVEGMVAAAATETIQLVSLLGRLSDPSALAVAAASVTAHRGEAREAALLLERAAVGLPDADRPAVLAHAARLWEFALAPDEAARIRVVLVDQYPEAVEFPEAALALARWHARNPDGLDAALRLLEQLILTNPTSAVVPEARRELERLGGAA